MRIGEIQKYEITFGQHLHYYDFYNSEKLVDKFLSNVRNKFSTVSSRRRGDNFSIVCGFSIENKQLPPFATNGNDIILNSRYWSNELFQTNSFNDFTYFILRKNILKRVLSNGLTSSSWHFNCFSNINAKILDNPAQILW